MSSSASGASVRAHRNALQRLQRAMSKSDEQEQNLAVLLVHMPRYRSVHLSVGYDNAEFLMDGIAASLPALLRPEDTVCRLWSHDFVVLLPCIAHPAQAELAAQQIINRFEEPLMVAGQTLFMPAQVGIVLYPDFGDNAEDLLQCAERALMNASRTDQSVVFYGQPQSDDGIADGELREAVLNNRLRLFLQPRVEIATGYIAGAEALARWPGGEDTVNPEVFVAQAERNGLIMALTRWSLNSALRVSSECARQGRFLPVAVNLSPKVVHEKGVVEHILDALSIWNVPSRDLTVELTETALMRDPAVCARLLERLFDAGVRVAIDDFGVGYSSFAYLKRFVAHELKIDKAFMTGLLDDEKAARLVEAMIDLGHRLGMSVVAEGVESGEVFDRLAQMGCDYAQGFYTGPPVPAEGFFELSRRTAS